MKQCVREAVKNMASNLPSLWRYQQLAVLQVFDRLLHLEEPVLAGLAQVLVQDKVLAGIAGTYSSILPEVCHMRHALQHLHMLPCSSTGRTMPAVLNAHHPSLRTCLS